MKLDFQHLMHEATQLTLTGKPQAATAAIQEALGRRPEPETGSATSGRFIAGHYANVAGHRDYKLFIPPDAAGRSLPLLVMLHGCTQNPDDFAAGTSMNDVALTHGFFVLYPAQSQRVNPQRCWNWFKHTHQRRDHGEPALLAGLTRSMTEQYAIDADRVYIAGLSAGGAMAAILADTYPDVYAAAGIHSGLAAGAASDLPSALAAMKGGGIAHRTRGNNVPVIVFHGDADTVVHPSNSEQVVAASISAGTVRTSEHIPHKAGGRPCTRHVHRAHDGLIVAEHWIVHGAPHAWSGGSVRGSYTDGKGPDASVEMVRFFAEHPRLPVH